MNGVSRDGDKEKGGREGADEEMTLNLNEKQSDYLRCVLKRRKPHVAIFSRS